MDLLAFAVHFAEKKLVFCKSLCYNPKMTVIVVVRLFFGIQRELHENRGVQRLGLRTENAKCTCNFIYN